MWSSAQANQTLSEIVKLFSSEQLEDTITRAWIIEPAKPCSKWSLSNIVTMLAQGTFDARGYQQWQEAERHVKKGAHAIHILGPTTAKIKEKNEVPQQDGTIQIVETEKVALVGFHAIPVFRVEDTEGKPLPEYQPRNLPPLMEVAKKWKITVKYSLLENLFAGAYASYRPDKHEISLATEDETVFFHELAHAADGRNGNLKGGQDPEQEAVAELTAAVLGRLYGRNIDGHAWNYLAHYAKTRNPAEIGKLCYRVLGRVEKALNVILANADTTATQTN